MNVSSLEFNFVNFEFVTLLQCMTKMCEWYSISRKQFIHEIHKTNPMRNLRLLQYLSYYLAKHFWSGSSMMPFILTDDLDPLRLWPLKSYRWFCLFSFLRIGAHVLVQVYITFWYMGFLKSRSSVLSGINMSGGINKGQKITVSSAIDYIHALAVVHANMHEFSIHIYVPIESERPLLKERKRDSLENQLDYISRSFKMLHVCFIRASCLICLKLKIPLLYITWWAPMDSCYGIINTVVF